jgi:hypothetical protein
MRAEADDGGVATIEMRPDQLRSFAGQGALVAAISEDGRHAHTALDADFLGPYELRIPTRMERITGRLLDEIGAPLANVRACVDDPTQSGDGAPLEARGADPFTDAQGAFEITGLLDRPYTLRFTRQEPFLVHDVQDVRAGSEGLVVQIPSTAVRPLVEGLVLDAYGEPVAGVQVRPFVTTTTPAMVGAVVVGTGVKTDGEGRFTIARLPISVAAFFVDPFPNDERVSTRCEVPPGAFDGTLVLRPDFECDVVAGLREGMIGATLQFVDAEGAVLAAEEIATHRALRRSDVQQKPDGTFGRLRVTQRARAVRVLNANSELLRTVAIALAVTEQNRLEL